MKTGKRSYVSRSRREENNYGKLILIVIALILTVSLLYIGMKIIAIKNSPDFDLNKRAAYYFVIPKKDTDLEKLIQSGTNNKLLLINGEKRTVKVIDIPVSLFVNSKRLETSAISPKDFVTYLLETIGTKVDYIYVIYQKPEYFNKIGVSSVDELIQKYGKSGLKFIDYFTIQRQVSELRPESVITDGALAKLYYALGKFSISNYSLPLLTQTPLKITVDGKVYYRTYLDEEKIEDFVKDLNK